MAGPETDVQVQFAGMKNYFNSYTLPGRMTCVLAVYGGIALLVLYFELRSKQLQLWKQYKRVLNCTSSVNFPCLEKLMTTPHVILNFHNKLWIWGAGGRRSQLLVWCFIVSWFYRIISSLSGKYQCVLPCAVPYGLRSAFTGILVSSYKHEWGGISCKYWYLCFAGEETRAPGDCRPFSKWLFSELPGPRPVLMSVLPSFTSPAYKALNTFTYTPLSTFFLLQTNKRHDFSIIFSPLSPFLYSCLSRGLVQASC